MPSTPRTRALTLVLACLALVAVVLTARPAEAASVNLHRGSHGKRVLLLEGRLHRLGLLAASAVDGRFRRATVTAVVRFQRPAHLPATGRVNLRTWNAVAGEVTRRAQSARGPTPTILGHRGAVRPGLAEDTLQSLRYAHGWADVLEFDLRLTADHQLVLMHDDTLDRTTSCSGLVSTWTLADLRASCRVGDQPIPTFDQAAAYLAQVSEPIAPELKDEGIGDQDIGAFLAILDRYGLTGRSYVQSLSGSVLERLRAMRPGIRTVLVAKEIPSVPLVKGSGAGTVAVRIEDVTAARVALYKRSGLHVWVYTALDRAGLARARALRANAVVTDIPRQARRYFHP